MPANGAKFLSYDDLKASNRCSVIGKPARTIELRLTGNYGALFWSHQRALRWKCRPDRAELWASVYALSSRDPSDDERTRCTCHGMWSLLDTGKASGNPSAYRHINPEHHGSIYRNRK